MKKPGFRAAAASDGALELMIYGDIVDAATLSMLEAWGYSTEGFVSALNVKNALDGAGTYAKIRLRINSPGGDAFEGMAIHSLLTTQAKPVEAIVDGIAASAASIVAMAGGSRTMGRSAMMMIHKAWSGCVGNARDMEKMSGTLDKIDESIAAAYVDRTGKDLAEVMAMMDAETWLSADDCVAQGFATAIAEPPAERGPSARFDRRFAAALLRFRRVPESLQAALRARAIENDDDEDALACACGCAACQNGDCAECSNPDCDDAQCKDCPMQGGGNAESNLSLYEARAKMLLR